MGANLAVRADSARELAQPSGPPQAQGGERPALGLPEADLRGTRGDAAGRILAFMCPMAPQLLIPHTLGMSLLHRLALGTPHDRGIELALSSC